MKLRTARSASLAGAVLIAAMSLNPAAHADDNNDFNHKEARFASGAGNIIFLAAGLTLPLLEDGKQAKDHSLRVADALITSTVLAEGLKRLVREDRPDSNDPTSFPSGHATAAFTVAAMQSAYHPKQALWWYGGATLIAASRVQLRRHFVHDVVAGAALGYGVAHFEMHRQHGLLLFPFIDSDPHAARHTMGIGMTKTF
jgi:hypothetical protein